MGFIHIGITVIQKKFVLANKIKKTVIIWLLLCCIMTVSLFLMLLVTVVSLLSKSFGTDSFIQEHKIRAFSFFSFRELPEEKRIVKYSVKCITHFSEANLRPG